MIILTTQCRSFNSKLPLCFTAHFEIKENLIHIILELINDVLLNSSNN